MSHRKTDLGIPRPKKSAKVVLGRMNDVAVAQTMLAQLVGVASNGSEPTTPTAPQQQLAFAAGGILGWHRRRAAEINVALVKDWNSFVRAKPFWPCEQNATT